MARTILGAGTGMTTFVGHVPVKFISSEMFSARTVFERERETYTMKNIAKSIKNFLVSEDGPTAVEYAVMLALIVIVCLTAITAVGNNASAKFQAISTAIAAPAAGP